MDIIDKKIIQMLNTNCRTTYQDLGSNLGISANAVKKRVQKLLDGGVIIGYRVLPSLAMMNANLVFALVQCDGSENSPELMNQIGNTPVFHHVSKIVSTEGGTYYAIGWYVGLRQLSEVGQHIRGLDGVERVEIHNLLWERGNSLELTKLHLRVLKQLKKDPRMASQDVARNAGITTRRARRAIVELVESGAFLFRTRWNMSTGEQTQFLVRIHYEESEVSGQDVVDWLWKEFPMEFWEPYVSASEPVVFANFVTDTLRDAERVSERVGEASFAKSTSTYVSYSNAKFRRQGDIWLEEILHSGEE